MICSCTRESYRYGSEKDEYLKVTYFSKERSKKTWIEQLEITLHIV